LGGVAVAFFAGVLLGWSVAFLTQRGAREREAATWQTEKSELVQRAEKAEKNIKTALATEQTRFSLILKTELRMASDLRDALNAARSDWARIVEIDRQMNDRQSASEDYINSSTAAAIARASSPEARSSLERLRADSLQKARSVAPSTGMLLATRRQLAAKAQSKATTILGSPLADAELNDVLGSGLESADDARATVSRVVNAHLDQIDAAARLLMPSGG
jgi:cell division protein FtsI/penicillin-binding protein 2